MLKRSCGVTIPRNVLEESVTGTASVSRLITVKAASNVVSGCIGRKIGFMIAEMSVVESLEIILISSLTTVPRYLLD